ncbi:hypothetical protein F4780DRAFT_737501 [Xylariomycetidae sp. FL0641]|nr:hypothetical protein F4780DRAFT_737501 [Xylariomycetidae sp. FL0641]
MRSHNKGNPLKVALSVLFILVLWNIPFASTSSPPSASPSAETEVICHTDNPAECYPKVFSATDEFQVVRDDQDLPPGLHVQLDIQTSQKVAKIYDPSEEDTTQERQSDIVIVEPEQASVDDKPRVPPGAPAYEPVGLVKEPKEKDENFYAAMGIVKQNTADENERPGAEALDDALRVLDDFAPDMYYGQQVTDDPAAVHALFCLLTQGDGDDESRQQAREPQDRTDFLAASTLAAAVRNNAPALRSLEAAWDGVMAAPCTPGGQGARLGQEWYGGLEERSEGSTDEEDAWDTRLRLTVLDPLLRSPKVRDEFLARDGMRSFLDILLREGEAWGPRRAKIARIVSDIFLDEDSGAVPGVWPTKETAPSAVCGSGGPASRDEGCWEHHLEQIGKTSKDSEWSRDLLTMLKSKRPEASDDKTSEHVEL